MRAGQASDSPRGEHVIRRVRELPNHVYRRDRERIAARHIRFAEDLHAKFSDAERSQERKRLLALMDNARSMSDVDFELNKAELSQQLKPRDKVGELIEKIQEAKPGGDAGKAARMLLNPAAVSILRKRSAAAG